MPKDVERNRYYTVSVPKQSRLQLQIEYDHKQTNVAESQLLALYASKYVAMLEAGTIPSAPVVPVKEQVKSVNGVVVLPQSDEGVNGNDLDSYGEPD